MESVVRAKMQNDMGIELETGTGSAHKGLLFEVYTG